MASGGTLLLDEIGELPPSLQAHLLRVMDSDGEYQRLGESATRRSRLRVVAATNRPLADLKNDFAARLTSRVQLPPLEARREDIPLLANLLVLRAAAPSPEVPARPARRPSDTARDLRASVQSYERKIIAEALAAAFGNQTEAAKRLNMPLRTFVRKVKALNLR